MTGPARRRMVSCACDYGEIEQMQSVPCAGEDYIISLSNPVEALRAPRAGSEMPVRSANIFGRDSEDRQIFPARSGTSTLEAGQLVAELAQTATLVSAN